MALRVALTFDDGPSEWTVPLLNVFKEHGGHGTFFVLGRAVGLHPAALGRMFAEGHEVGLHGFSHIPMTRLGNEALAEEMCESISAIRDINPFAKPRLYRPPFHNSDKRTQEICRMLGLEKVGASLDPGDWFKDADGIEAHIRSDVREGAVVGLHDGAPPGEEGSRAGTVEAVRRLLADGTLESVTVTELWSAL